MFLEVIMTNLILMVAHKFDHDPNVISSYDSILFKSHMGSIYKSQFAYYTTTRVYVEQTGNYVIEVKRDGYLYAWQKRRTNNGN